MLAHLRLDDGVARLGPYGRPALALDELGEGFRADGAVQYRRSWLLLEHVLRYEGGGQIARDGRAILVDDKAAVCVAVEGHPEVCLLCDHALLELAYVFGLDGVRRMVGEGAIELEVHGNVLERKMLDYGRNHLARHAVTGVDHDLQRPQALRVYKAQAMFGVIYGDVGLLHGTRIFRRLGEVPRDDEVTDFTWPGLPREG